MQKFFDDMLKKRFRDHGLAPDEPSLLDDPRYGEFKNEKVYYKHILVTLDYYIRQEWFPNAAASGMLGRFDPQAKWDGKPVNANDLIEEIRFETFNEIAGTPWDDEPKYDCDNIKNKLFGTSGLRDNLKQRVGFDTTPYRQFQKYEEFKLLKILYRTEKHYSDKVNITKLLGDLSLEIVDRSILGETSVHGQVVTELLTQVHLAIEQRFPARANQAIINLTMAWNEKLLQIGALTRSPRPKEVRMAELQRIRDYGKLLLERLDEPQPVSDKDLLESFYLRVLQLKQIARTHDIDRVTDFITGSKQTKNLSKQQIRTMPFPHSVITDAVTFVREHMNAIAPFIYPEVKITKKHRQFLLKQATAVPELLALYNKQKIGDKQELTTLFLLSCLQEIELSHSLSEGEDEKAFKNEYYLADGKPRTLTSVFKKMTKQMNVEEVFQLVWTIKLGRRINANLGRLDEYLLLVDIGTVCNQMINKTMKVPDLDTMRVWNEFLLSQMIVNETVPIVLAAGEFDRNITQMTGLSCDLRTMRLFSYFTNETISGALTQPIVRKIELAMREPRPEELQVMKFILFGEEYLLGFFIDLARRRFVLQFFMPRTNDEECTLMVNAGLGNFVNGHERLTGR
ncbi:hypothetical protein [Paenibacillus polymyxa]|uniref:hypothetical protein n=1 Tax=Paenibacillus polymyxa TaxID=1406 RepID=UPI002ED126F7|nr:hypothetical protein [Paenibacillus polymyxa]